MVVESYREGMDERALADDVAALGVLAEPQRARIYAQLADASTALTRQEICDALDIGRTLAAFHLDKLQRAGLVHVVSPAASAGGRGRPPTRYAVSTRELLASIPPRRYDLLAEVLVRAASLEGGSLRERALTAARAHGEELAESARARLAAPTGGETLPAVLADLGYRPRRDGADVVLANCPFDRLRRVDTELVCSINLALAEGLLRGLGDDAVVARLRPHESACCVVLESVSE